jgi:hypothetical protein
VYGGGVCIASWGVAFIACRVVEGVSDCFFDIFMHISWNYMDRYEFKWKEGTLSIVLSISPSLTKNDLSRSTIP